MDALQAIKGRKSYRSTFKTEPIPREDLREIVEAGFLAPSGHNLQTTKFIAVDDPELVKKLAEIYGHEWAATAPAAILLLTKKVIAPSGETYYIQDFVSRGRKYSDCGYGKGICDNLDRRTAPSQWRGQKDGTASGCAGGFKCGSLPSDWNTGFHGSGSKEDGF